MNVDNLVIKKKPNIKPELDEISEAKKEIANLMSIVEEKNERIRLKEEQAYREEQERKFELSTKSLEDLIDKVRYFKQTAPFNQNYTFLKRLTQFYNHLDNYEKSPVYNTKEPLEFGEAREFIRRIKNSGIAALDVLGSETYRELLKSFTDRFLAIEKSLRAIEKKVKTLG